MEEEKTTAAALGDGHKQMSAKCRCLWDTGVLVCLLPYVDMVHASAIWTCLPLHFLDSNWSLLIFGLTVTMMFMIRFPLIVAVNRCGEWVAIMTVLICSFASLPMAIYPDSMTAVIAGAISNSLAGNLVQVNHALIVRFFTDMQKQKRALRVSTCMEVFGYSSGSFLGGLIYEFGGFTLYSWFQVAAIAIHSALYFSTTVSRASFRDRLGLAKSSGQDSEHESSEREPPLLSVFLPVMACIGAEFVNLCAYGTEWLLFAVYFRQVYNWSSAWTGAAQCAGDLIAGLSLFMMACKPDTSDSAGIPAKYSCRAILQKTMQLPWNIPILLILHSVFFYMLAQPMFAVAVIGQIFMGTVFVFIEQAVHECFLIYGQGNVQLYRKIMFVQAVAYNSGLVAPMMPMTFVYSTIDKAAPFLIMSGITLGFAICFTVFFLRRLSPSRLTFVGLAAAEEKLLRLSDTEATVSATIVKGCAAKEGAMPSRRSLMFKLFWASRGCAGYPGNRPEDVAKDQGSAESQDDFVVPKVQSADSTIEAI